MPSMLAHAAPDTQSNDDERDEPDGEADLEPLFYGDGVLDEEFGEVGGVEGEEGDGAGGQVRGRGGEEGEGEVGAVGGGVPGVGA